MLILFPNFGLHFFLSNKILCNDLSALSYLSESMVFIVDCRPTVRVYLSITIQSKLFSNNDQYCPLGTQNVLNIINDVIPSNPKEMEITSTCYTHHLQSPNNLSRQPLPIVTEAKYQGYQGFVQVYFNKGRSYYCRPLPV